MYRILIIDDNKLDTEVAKLSLSNHQVIVSHSAFEGLRLVKEMVPDAVITEIDLPYMDGYHIIESIKSCESTNHIPVIVLSAEKNSVSEERTVSMGAADFIQKPFVPSVLDMKVTQIIENAQKEKSLSEKLTAMQERSSKDILTGLYNRDYAQKKVDAYIKEHHCGTLYMIDMDNFKAINDNYGHEAGDKTLITFADALNTNAVPESILSRIGGDEFVAFLPGRRTREELASFAGQLIGDLACRLESFRYDTNTSVSLGIAEAGIDGNSFDELYNAGDRALCHVKMNGKNSYCFCSDIKAQEAERAHKLEKLGTIREHMIRKDDDKSHPFDINMNSFTCIYQFLVRQGNAPRLILLTLTDLVEKEEDEVADRVENMLMENMRKTDVFTRYSSRQFIVMFQNVDVDTSKEIARLICTKGKEVCGVDMVFEVGD